MILILFLHVLEKNQNPKFGGHYNDGSIF